MVFWLGFFIGLGFFSCNLNQTSCVLQTVKSQCCCTEQECANTNRSPQRGHSCPGQGLQGVSEPGGQGCVSCEELNDLLCLVAELKEEMERLGSIRESEREIERWS